MYRPQVFFVCHVGISNTQNMFDKEQSWNETGASELGHYHANWKWLCQI
jgi:hypothetical protein